MISSKKIVFSRNLFVVLVGFFIALTFLSVDIKSAIACDGDSDCYSGQTCSSGKCSCTRDMHCGSAYLGKCGDDFFCKCSNTSYGDCNGKISDGCETAIKSTDTDNCGSCGNECSATQKCEGGVCKSTSSGCPTGYAECGGSSSTDCETEVYSDENNCGSCSNVCSSGSTCSKGKCSGSGTATSTDSGSTGWGGPQGPWTPCAGYYCGSNASCYNAKCYCSGGTKDCDGSTTNGCECEGLFRTCTSKKCACETGYNDCDGNAKNGCETGGACPPCKPKQTRTCNTTDICDGVQTCSSDGYWLPCVRTIDQKCTPYSTGKCSPTIEGKKCTTVTGTIQCNSCGSKWGACVAPSGLTCCPGSEEVCTIGSCTGVKSCNVDGNQKGQCVSGEEICCEKDTDCADSNECTTEKCVSNKCEYAAKEDCRTLEPIKCKNNQSCASADSCVAGFCTPLKCNEKFIIKDHSCACEGNKCGEGCYFSSGICCEQSWNENFDSCTFDFGYYDERVGLSKNKEAVNLLVTAKKTAETGNLTKAAVYAKIALVKAEVALSEESQDLKLKVNSIANEAKTLLENGNFSLAHDKADEAIDVLGAGASGVQIEEKPTQWQENRLAIIAFALVALSIVGFIVYVILTPKI